MKTLPHLLRFPGSLANGRSAGHSSRATARARSFLPSAAVVLLMAAPSAIPAAASAKTLSCDCTKGQFFVMPSNCPTSIASIDILTGSNLDAWLANHPARRATLADFTSFWQSNNALWQRKFFPSMMAFGAGLDDDADLARIDFYPEGTSGVTDLLNNSNLFTFDVGIGILTNAVKRDFYTALPRFAFVNQLLNDWTLGPYGKGSVALGYGYGLPGRGLDEVSAERAEHYWLIPTRYLDDPGPTGEWTKNSPLSTADWSRHLVGIGELPYADNDYTMKYNSGHKPWVSTGALSVITNMMPAWANAFCKVRGIQSFDSLLANATWEHTDRGVGTGLCLTNLICQLPKNSRVALDRSARLTPYRWILANEIAAVCERTIDGYHPAEWTDRTNADARASVKFPTAQMMRYRFNELTFSGDVRAEAVSTNRVLKLHIPSDASKPYVTLNPADLASIGLDFNGCVTNRVCATNIVEHTLAGWRDCSQELSVSAGTVALDIYNHTAAAYSFKIDDNRAASFYQMVYGGEITPAGLVTPSVWVDYTSSPWKIILRGKWREDAGIGYFEWTGGNDYLVIGEIARLGGASSNVEAVVSTSYTADLLGRSPLGAARYQSDAYPSTTADVRLKDTASLSPVGRAWFLQDYWKSQVYGFATCGVSTSLDATTDVVVNGRFDALTNEASKATLYTRHWKQGTTGGVSSSQYQWELAMDRDAQLADVVSRVSTDLPAPTREAADKLDTDALASSVRADLYRLGGTWKTVPEDHPDFPGQALLTIPWTLTKSTVEISKDDAASNPLFSLTFRVTATLSGDDAVTPRYSPAAAYEVRPVVVTDWSFPAMKPE